MLYFTSSLSQLLCGPCTLWRGALGGTGSHQHWSIASTPPPCRLPEGLHKAVVLQAEVRLASARVWREQGACKFQVACGCGSTAGRRQCWKCWTQGPRYQGPAPTGLLTWGSINPPSACLQVPGCAADGAHCHCHAAGAARCGAAAGHPAVPDVQELLQPAQPQVSHAQLRHFWGGVGWGRAGKGVIKFPGYQSTLAGAATSGQIGCIVSLSGFAPYDRVKGMLCLLCHPLQVRGAQEEEGGSLH